MDDFIKTDQLDALAIRCWSEMQRKYGISPCVVMGVFNQMMIPVVCEMDVTNAVAMLGLALASDSPSACMDFNNNFGRQPDKCILFHCGSLPPALMKGSGKLQQHKMLSKTFGDGCSWGLNVGDMYTGEITLASMRTDNGKLQFYSQKGIITEDRVDDGFFGTYGVLEIEDLQKKLKIMSENGFRHHTVIAAGDVSDVLNEAFSKYLGYEQVSLY